MVQDNVPVHTVHYPWCTSLQTMSCTSTTGEAAVETLHWREHKHKAVASSLELPLPQNSLQQSIHLDQGHNSVHDVCIVNCIPSSPCTPLDRSKRCSGE